jgi:EthD domain-containing protein
VYHRGVVEILFLCTRRPELSHAAYVAHLRERHAPLALRHHATLRGYALNEVEESLPGAPPLDSINALAFDSLADFATRLYDSAEGERLVTEDHARFLGGASGYAGAWRVHRQAEDLGAHWLCALARRPEVSRERFHALLDAELVPEILASQPGASRIAILRVERKLFPAEAPDWDAFLDLGFADAARAPLHPFASADCSVMLRRTVVGLCAATAPWRVREQLLRRPS